VFFDVGLRHCERLYFNVNIEVGAEMKIASTSSLNI
jgi:hypothetical protein